jgi:hypothetical protein
METVFRVAMDGGLTRRRVRVTGANNYVVIRPQCMGTDDAHGSPATVGRHGNQGMLRIESANRQIGWRRPFLIESLEKLREFLCGIDQRAPAGITGKLRSAMANGTVWAALDHVADPKRVAARWAEAMKPRRANRRDGIAAEDDRGVCRVGRLGQSPFEFQLCWGNLRQSSRRFRQSANGIGRHETVSPQLEK